MNKIRWYYDRISRNWIIQVLDNNNYEIESEYCGNKNDVDFITDYFKNKYHTTDCRKYRYGE